LISASPSEFTVIEAALKRLDVLPIQVLIEASIAEVTRTDDIKYGLQFSHQESSARFCAFVCVLVNANLDAVVWRSCVLLAARFRLYRFSHGNFPLTIC
jgi:type II secretory pathway component GspD/PulD (secretin)